MPETWAYIAFSTDDLGVHYFSFFILYFVNTFFIPRYISAQLKICYTVVMDHFRRRAQIRLFQMLIISTESADVICDKL